MVKIGSAWRITLISRLLAPRLNFLFFLFLFLFFFFMHCWYSEKIGVAAPISETSAMKWRNGMASGGRRGRKWKMWRSVARQPSDNSIGNGVAWRRKMKAA
jgi:hypothetical protein